MARTEGWRCQPAGSMAVERSGQILMSRICKAGRRFCTQEYLLWKKDALNPYGSSVKLTYTAAFPFIYTTSADGNEAFLALANANPLLDRPVTVTGQPFDIHSKNSALIVAVNKAWKLIFIPV